MDQTEPGDPARSEALRASASRLAAVERSGLLDSAAEEAFDASTRLAAMLLKVPASFVSVVARDRDFYKSQFGFPDALAAGRELCGETFCHHVLSQDATLAIADTHASSQWRAVQTVQSLGVRAYVGVPLRLDGQIVGSFCVIDQVPRDWSAEDLATLEQLALSASREIGLRAALADAREAATRWQKLVAAREEMVAVLAHDLRTPLQVLELNARLLQLSCTPAQQPIAARIGRTTALMNDITNELLAEHAGRPEAAARPTTIEVSALLHSVAETMALIASRADIGLRVDDGKAAGTAGAAPLSIVADYAQMMRVFCNLVGNAIKYSQAGGSVTLTAVREGDQACMRVADRGLGMSGAEQARAFDRGWQGAEGLARGDGIGLGLPIVKALVERHGGQVTILSQLAQGTTVTVCLAASPAGKEAVRTEPVEGQRTA